MPEEKDLLELIEIITTAIEIHGREEDFFRRSSEASANREAKALLLEIADDIGQYREKLEKRRQKLRDNIDALETARRKKGTA